MWRLRPCLLLTASLIFSCWADVFVSTTGSDEDGDGSRIAPYRTVGLAVTRATPESTILIDCGEYHEHFTITKSLEIEGGWSGECKPTINGAVTLSTPSEQAIDISLANVQVSTTNQLVGQGGLFMGAGLGNIMLDSVAFDSRGVNRTDLDQVISVSTANSFRSLALINCTANYFIMTYTGPPPTQQHNSRLSFISFRAEFTWLLADSIEEIRMVDSRVDVMAVRTRHMKRATPSIYISHSVVFSSLQLESAAVTIHEIAAYNATILLGRTAEPAQQEHIAWVITSSIFNSSGIVLLQQPLTQNCSISLRHNKFVGDKSVQSVLDSSQDASTPVIIRLTNSDGCWVDAKENWFGDLSGPTSCCNPAGTGSYLWPGVDASNWCLDKNCSQISSHSLSSTCSIEAMCYKGEDYLFGLLGAVQFIVVFAAVWRLLMLCRTPRKSDPVKSQLLAISGCLMAGSMVVAVAFVVFALRFSSNTPTLKLSGHWSVSLLIPVILSSVLLFLQGIFSLTVALWRKGIVLFLVIGAMNTILSLVAIPVLYSTSPVLQSVMGYATFKLNVLFRLNTESTVFSPAIPYEIVLLFVFTLPMAIIQLRGINLVWRLLVQCYYPDLHKLYTGVDETQSLLEKKDDIIRPGQLARPARILVSVAIPKLLLSVALVASLVDLVIRIAPYLIRLDKHLVQYIGLAIVLAVTGSVTAIPVVLFGGFTLFKRFYNSALLLAYVGLTVGLVGLNCFVVGITVSFATSSGDKLFDTYYVDYNEIIHEFKSEMVAHTVSTIVLLGVQMLAQIGHATAAFVYRQRVVRELPSIMSDKIDNALDDIYEGR